jgi:nucleoside-diphosphate-sugar epimerase
MRASDSITLWGNGEEARDLLYVDDLVDFVKCAINKQGAAYALFNCGSGIPTTVNELARAIIKASGKDISVVHDLSAPSIPTSLHLDCTRADRALDWKPATSLEQGLMKTIEWYKENVR